ncbi:MAG: hypothetical protein ACRYHQ_05375, partial [Janthinobacterium lividum]
PGSHRWQRLGNLQARLDRRSLGCGRLACRDLNGRVATLAEMKNRFFRWWLSLFTPQGVIGWFVGAILAGGFILSYQSTKPPSHMLGATEDDGVAVIGGQMVVKYHNLKQRYCRNNVTRWLYNPEFKIGDDAITLWIPLGTSAAPPVALGDQRYALGLTIPQTTLSGTYHYTATTDYSCGVFSWLEPPSVRSPDLIVQIVKPTPDSPPQIVVAEPNGVTVVPSGEKK